MLRYIEVPETVETEIRKFVVMRSKRESLVGDVNDSYEALVAPHERTQESRYGIMKPLWKFVAAISIVILLSGCTSAKDVEEIACKYVSIIIQDEWNYLARTNGAFRKYMSSGNYIPTTCAVVKLGEPLRKNYWHDATAYLHNGTEVGITVEVKDGHVYVQMTEELFWRWKY